MKKLSAMLGHRLHEYVPILFALITSMRASINLAFGRGHFNTALKWSSINTNNKPIPWFTYPAIDFLDSIDLSDKKVFEYGAGNSTIYFAQRAKSITSIEDDVNWYNEIVTRLGTNIKNTNILYKGTKDSYINAVNSSKGKYDIIIIDGSYREACAINALEKIDRGGFIIFDDADDRHFRKAVEILDGSKLRKIIFRGFVPIIPYETTTAFYLNL